MKKIRLFISLICCMALCACSDFLDKEQKTDINLEYEQVFKDPHRAPGFLNNAYNDLISGFSQINGNTLLATACDDAKHSDAGSPVQFICSNSINSSYNPDDIWSAMYKGIRKCNIFLSEIDGLIAKYNSIPERERPFYKGQAYFLRAFFHFELLKRYQNIPYVDRVLDPNNEDEVYGIPQSSFHKVVEYISIDCDSAINLLPGRVGAGQGDFQSLLLGRPMKAAPMALKARLLLYAASPLNNPANEKELWEAAETASADIYRNASNLGLALRSKGEFSAIFTDPSDKNREVIFATAAFESNSLESNNFPISYQGKGFTNPTQELVDAFPMVATSYSNPMNRYDPDEPYKDREDRFYATILYNDATFKNTNVEAYIGGKDGLYSTNVATKTGYYMRKFITSSINLEQGENTYKRWIFFRYAEVILNYAEARNEVLDQPDKTVHDLLNLIRNRVGLRPFANASQYITDKEEMREYIKKERRLEFALEDHRFWDLRRWKDAETILNNPIHGMQITKDEDGKFTYTPFEVEKRTFDSKFYWYPIPRNEVLKYKNKGIDFKQNPGWD